MPLHSPKRVLFLQLPCIDNDVVGPGENVYLAAAYLRWAMKKAGEDRYYEAVVPPLDAGLLDDSHLIKYIVSVKPVVVCVTLYLWNVERSLTVLGKLKLACPGLKIVVGGPEVAVDHPFLFKGGIVDVAVTGEGEPVIAPILAALRHDLRPVVPTTAWKHGNRYLWGPRPKAALRLADILPPPEHESNRPFAGGIGYLEAGRGCPLRCTFCCYNQRRRSASYLGAGDVIRRVKVLLERGASEIRFVDPTFNSNPEFEWILEGLVTINRRRKFRMFAELRAETVTRRQADLLAAANFTDIEVGVQSRDPVVLKAVRRPTVLPDLDRGIRLLTDRGIRLTVDVMCGLPGQSTGDLETSVRWAAEVPGSHVQFLHTLLLPGTELRDRRKQLGLSAQSRPPYRVIRTSLLSEADIMKAETMAHQVTGATTDCQTRRFVGTKLPDLFPDVSEVFADSLPQTIPGREIRRAVVIRGDDLFGSRRVICRFIRRAVKFEAHALWQFILSPSSEEPLDLLEALINEIDRFPASYLDRTTVSAGSSRLASRRIMILLRRGIRYDREWTDAAEALLGQAFH